MKTMKSVVAFCKAHGTANSRIIDLYKAFAVFSGGGWSLEEFEQALVKLKKRVIVHLEERCIKYLADNGINAYEKFIREDQFISERLWSQLTGSPAHENRPTLMAKTHLDDTSKEPSSGTEEKPPKAPEPVSMSQEAKAVLSDLDEDSDRYEKLMPTNWNTMSFGEQVDFTKKVQHKGFFDYILGTDKKLKNFFEKKRISPSSLNLYVTLFSFPSSNYSEESKALLRSFIDVLNSVGRARLQYVQCSNPDVVEIREVR